MGETEEHLRDRAVQLVDRWRKNGKMWDKVEGKVIIFPKTWQEETFNKQEWTEKITREEFRRRIAKCK